jgi:uracil DNA glycosylase
MNVTIEESWRKILGDEFSKPYFPKIKEFLLQEINA